MKSYNKPKVQNLQPTTTNSLLRAAGMLYQKVLQRNRCTEKANTNKNMSVSKVNVLLVCKL